MRLYSIRQRYGLAWPGKFPRINWRLWLDGLMFVALLISVYALVDFIGANIKLADRAVVAERQKMHAESALAHCLNGQSLTGNSEGWIICDKAYWVNL